MITSFFKTSKPIHYIIFLVVLTSVFVYQRISVITHPNPLKELGYLFVVLASFLALVFIVTKNNLTHNNSYAALYFCLFMGLIPSSIDTNSILVSNLFIVLSLRRIVSLKTKTNIKKKLFDAAMWICLAAIFEPWAILFLAVLFIGMLLYSVFQIKNIAIPFCGIIAIGILLVCYRLLLVNTFPYLDEFLPTVHFHAFSFNLITHGGSFLFLAIILFGTFNFIIIRFLKNRLKTPNFSVLILAIFIGVIIAFIRSSNDVGGYLFAFVPSAIVMAKFSETTKYRWLSELVIGILFFAGLLQMGLNISFTVN